MRSVTVELPLPPSTNVMWRTVYSRGSIRIVTSKVGRVFRHACAPILKDYRSAFTGDVSVECQFFFRNERSDLDNRLKALLDVLQVGELGFGLYRNDLQIVALHAYKHLDKDNPRVVVKVEEV